MEAPDGRRVDDLSGPPGRFQPGPVALTRHRGAEASAPCIGAPASNRPRRPP